MQALAQHDCLFRNRETARWVAFGDLDEYLVVPPPASLPSILTRHQDAAYISHGAYRYSVERCEAEDVFAPTQAKYAVEMLVYREREPFCDEKGKDKSRCTNYYGHRKMFQNPRKVGWECPALAAAGSPRCEDSDYCTPTVPASYCRTIRTCLNEKCTACMRDRAARKAWGDVSIRGSQHKGGAQGLDL